MKRAFFFDIGNTLLADPFPEAVGVVVDHLIHAGQLEAGRRAEAISALSTANQTVDGLGFSHFWGEEEILRQALQSLSLRSSRRVVHECLGIYRAAVTELYKQRASLLALPTSRLRILLDQLRTDYTLGLISDERMASVPRYLDVLGVPEFFDVIVTSEEAGVAKPDPAIFLLALKRASAVPSASVFVGNDYLRDIKGARGVGMQTVYFTRFNPDRPGRGETANLVTADLIRVLDLARGP